MEKARKLATIWNRLEGSLQQKKEVIKDEAKKVKDSPVILNPEVMPQKRLILLDSFVPGFSMRTSGGYNGASPIYPMEYSWTIPWYADSPNLTNVRIYPVRLPYGMIYRYPTKTLYISIPFRDSFVLSIGDAGTDGRCLASTNIPLKISDGANWQGITLSFGSPYEDVLSRPVLCADGVASPAGFTCSIPVGSLAVGDQVVFYTSSGSRITSSTITSIISDGASYTISPVNLPANFVFEIRKNRFTMVVEYSIE